MRKTRIIEKTRLEGKVVSVNLTGSFHNTYGKHPKSIPYVAISIQDDSGKEKFFETCIDNERDIERAKKALIGQRVIFQEEMRNKYNEIDDYKMFVEKQMKVKSGKFKGITYRNRETYMPPI